MLFQWVCTFLSPEILHSLSYFIIILLLLVASHDKMTVIAGKIITNVIVFFSAGRPFGYKEIKQYKCDVKAFFLKLN